MNTSHCAHFKNISYSQVESKAEQQRLHLIEWKDSKNACGRHLVTNVVKKSVQGDTLNNPVNFPSGKRLLVERR